MAINNVNKLRLSGLQSGLDTDTVVRSMLSTYQQKLDNRFQKNTLMEWKSAAYRDINKELKSFRETYMSALSGKNMMSKLSYRDYKVNMITKNESVNVTAGPGAIAGDYEIEEITQLAEAAKAQGARVFEGGSYSSGTKLSELALKNGFEFVKADPDDPDSKGEISFKINGKEFTFDENATIGDLMRGVNNAGLGVTIRYSELQKGFSIASDKTGKDGKIVIENVKGNAFGPDGALGIDAGTYEGKNAEAVINGAAVSVASNTFTFDGVTYTLTGKTSTPIRFSVEADHEKTVDKIVAFVDDYNKMVEGFQSKIAEKTYRKYPPLTDAQRKEMKEEEITEWEKYAKSGMLSGDSYVKSMLSEFRGAIYSKTEGAGKSLYDIGVTTGNWQDGAKIKLDRDKLLAALKEDPESVEKMFVGNGGNNPEDKGLLQRVSDAMLTYTKGTTDIALDSLERQISSGKKLDEDLTRKMEAREQALWKQFSAMESALAKMNSMSGWISSLMGGG